MENTIDKRAQMMGTEKVPVAILKLAVPAIISMTVMAIYNMADTYFVSLASDSDLGVAAVSVFLPVLLIMQSVAVLFAAGGAAYLSRLLGAKDLCKAGQTASITIALSFFSGIAMLILGLIFARPLLLLLGASDATITDALAYANVMFLAAPAQLTNMAFNNLLRAEGNATKSMIGIIIGAVLNIVLDPIFISVLGMGVEGAAIATAISQCVSFVILGSNYLRKKTVARVSFKKLRFDKQIVQYILKVGVSNFLIQVFTGISFAVINIFTKTYGDGAIAAIGIVNRLQFLGFAILFGFSQGFQPVAGYNFGANRFDRLKTSLKFGIGMAVLIGLAITLAFRLFAPEFIGIFTSDQSVTQTGIEALQWFTAAFPLTAFSLIIMMTYQALGKALGALILAICRQGVCLIPAVLVLANVFGFFGILISPLVSDIVSGVLALVLAVRVFRFTRQKQQAFERDGLQPGAGR
ncbi:MATE family efflux transporter [Christensenellaceae bacterium OttesenSCG-928-K19]|nr:MATE family efflux transporter [Christensenellaceae bacterium OttesenSCG-928-K19]